MFQSKDLSSLHIYTWLTQNLLNIGKLDNKGKQARVTICPNAHIVRTQLKPCGIYSCLRLLHVGFLLDHFIINLCSLSFSIFHVFLLSETCRILEFVQPEEDNYLENHVIKSLMVDNKDQCELRCYAENFCSSFNLGISETRGKLKCELSDSDHFQHPEHLICKEGFSYHPTMVGILQRKGKPKIYSPTPIPLLILDRRSPPWYKFRSLLSLPLP